MTPFATQDLSSFDPALIQIGISACVIGHPVRFDGGHKKLHFAEQQLGHYVSYKPICPEMAIGLGAPRPAIRQLLLQNQLRICGSADISFDVTDDLQQFSQRQSQQLAGLTGYIVCAKSPSCGMERIKVYDDKGATLHHNGVGIFTQALREANPLLPVEENGRLNDPLIRENFVNRLFAYHHWQTLNHAGLTARALVDFHSHYKYLIMASSPQAYRELGRVVADLKSRPLAAVAAQYIAQLMPALEIKATRKTHANVLLHLQGYFKKQLPSREKQALSDTIHHYRQGLLPLMAPITLIRHLLERFPNDYLSGQRYLSPHPDALALRSVL